jgi:hypothetical protein
LKAVRVIPCPPSLFKSIGMKRIYATNFGICLAMILVFYAAFFWLAKYMTSI